MKKKIFILAILSSFQLLTPYVFAATPAEIKQFIDWKAKQPDPLLHKGTIGEIWVKQGITNPYTDPNIIKSAEAAINKADTRDASYALAGKAPLGRDWAAPQQITPNYAPASIGVGSPIVVGPGSATNVNSITPAEIKAFIDWKAKQPDPFLHKGTIGEIWAKQGITDPYSDPNIIKSAEDAIKRANAKDVSSGSQLPRDWLNGSPTLPVATPLPKPGVSTKPTGITNVGSAPVASTVNLPNSVANNTITFNSNNSSSSSGVVGPAPSVKLNPGTITMPMPDNRVPMGVVGPSPSVKPNPGTITMPMPDNRVPMGVVGPTPAVSPTPSKGTVTPAEIKAFIDWKAKQYNPLGTQGTIGETWVKQGIKDPYTDPNIVKSAEFSIERANSRDAAYLNAGKTPLPREWLTKTVTITTVADLPSIVIGPSSGKESTDSPFVVGPTSSTTSTTSNPPSSTSVFCGTGSHTNCGWLLKSK